MQQHMGYLEKRIFLNKENNHDHFIDVCITGKGERLLWYCSKDKFYGIYTICLDEELQKKFFKFIGADDSEGNFENQLQLFFNDCPPEEYGEKIRSILGNDDLGTIPHHIKFDRETDPHVLMADRSHSFPYLSEDRCENFFFDLIMNSVQEFQLGEATEIKIRVNGAEYEITDNGSGIAVEDREKFKDYEWKRILLFPHIVYDYPVILKDDSSVSESTDYFESKYRKAGYYKKSPKYYYKLSSLKANWFPGDSLAYTQCYAEAMKVFTIRNNQEYYFEFKNGYCISGRQVRELTTLKKGSRILWKPDKCCFENINISLQSLNTFLQQQAFLNAGLKISLDYNGKTFDYCYENGLEDYVSANINNPIFPVATMKFDFSTQSKKSFTNHEELEICLGIGSNGFLESYHNYRKMHCGSTVQGIYTEIADWLNAFLKHNYARLGHQYEKVQFSTEEIKRRFCIAIASYSEHTTFNNGAQNGLTNAFFEDAIKQSLRKILKDYFSNWNKKEQIEKTKAVINFILGNQ